MLQRQATSIVQPLRSACRLPVKPARFSALALSTALLLSMANSVQAQGELANPALLSQAARSEIARSEAEAPEAVQKAISRWESAANARDLQGLVKLYSPNYRNSDGLNRRALSTSIKGFWKQYSNVTYETEIVGWESTRRGGVAEVVTRIQGSRSEALRRLALVTTFRSRQTFENGQLLREEILSERSEVTTGDRPPTLQVNLPEQVAPGQKYNFDVIVLEPLETDLLIGGLLDEPVSPKGYGTPTRAELAPLVDAQTGTGPGGIFKIGEAPRSGSDRWISAVVMRKDGITMVTQRLRVANR